MDRSLHSPTAPPTRSQASLLSRPPPARALEGKLVTPTRDRAPQGAPLFSGPDAPCCHLRHLMRAHPGSRPVHVRSRGPQLTEARGFGQGQPCPRGRCWAGVAGRLDTYDPVDCTSRHPHQPHPSSVTHSWGPRCSSCVLSAGPVITTLARGSRAPSGRVPVLFQGCGGAKPRQGSGEVGCPALPA